MILAGQRTASVVGLIEFNQTYYLWFAGRPTESQSDVGAARPKDENLQSAKDGAKQKKAKSDKDATEPIAKKTNPQGEDGKKPKRPISESDVGPAEPKELQPEAGTIKIKILAKTSNDKEEEPAKKSLPSENEQKPTSDDSKPSRGKNILTKIMIVPNIIYYESNSLQLDLAEVVVLLNINNVVLS